MVGFADQVAQWSDNTRTKVEIAVRKISLDVFSAVILMSPVDTGRFRGNWQVAIGNIPSGTIQIDDKDGTASIGRVQAATLGLEAGQIIYLVNNLPYAQRLEYGYSQQAPGGMVRLTAQRFRPIVEAVARSINGG
ncbi:HK97 gp10 family phage protein [Aureimonas fodinaquatilis]|uniref:HK97 gp10 family phage protein n=1 Tax=Aureimonas fodinaquatilis TaxID=2565783 RepID=UPI00165E7AD2|nr:HK97 gp10 family phage protein [Aureimonas fodinaquatilis]